MDAKIALQMALLVLAETKAQDLHEGKAAHWWAADGSGGQALAAVAIALAEMDDLPNPWGWINYGGGQVWIDPPK